MTTPLRVLIVEDTPADAELMVLRLQEEGFAPAWQRVQTEADYLAALGPLETPPDLILADWRLPHFSGWRALQLLQEHGLDIPFVIVSGSIGEEAAVDALRQGAYDYVLKDRPIRLGRAVRHALEDKQIRDERQRATERLERLHQQDELILRSAAEGILGLDLQGNHTFVNPAAARMLGYEAEELLGRPSHSTWHHTKADGRPYPEEECQIYAAYREGEVHRVSTELFWRKDGGSFPVEYASTPIYQQNRLAGAVVTFADITQRTRLEEQLRQAQKMEVVGRLAGGVAHDFNNTLTAILGYSELVLRSLGSKDPRRRDVEEIKKAGGRAAALTRQLLDFSRKEVLQPQVLDLNDLLQNLAKMLQRLVGEDIELVFALAPALRRVRADPGQLEQVVMNLVVNARDAMPEGGKLTIETRAVTLQDGDVRPVWREELAAGPHVLLAVSDTGVGMDAATQSHLFEPFFTTKEEGRGTGLGLATVYGIVRQSGGYIRVESALGQGTTFYIALPSLGEALSEPAVWPEPAAEVRGTETVLLVEDEAVVRKLARQSLQESGYLVLEASHGAEALALAAGRAGPIHLLVTDVVMPGGLSGFQVAEQLSSLRPEMKVLYMSGYTDDPLLRHGPPHAGAAFLQKPFAFAELPHRVRQVLGGPAT